MHSDSHSIEAKTYVQNNDDLKINVLREGILLKYPILLIEIESEVAIFFKNLENKEKYIDKIITILKNEHVKIHF